MSEMKERLPTPSVDLVREWGRKYDEYPLTDFALRRVFHLYPKNVVESQVLLKVAALDALYRTHIFALETVARHIVTLNSDSDLIAGDHDIVDRIARVKITSKGEAKERKNYSFSSKFCWWHNHSSYPIYDSRARDLLWKYKMQDKFFDFSEGDIYCCNGYRRYYEIIVAFQSHYGLDSTTFKEIDKFLYMFRSDKSK